MSRRRTLAGQPSRRAAAEVRDDTSRVPPSSTANISPRHVDTVDIIKHVGNFGIQRRSIRKATLVAKSERPRRRLRLGPYDRLAGQEG